MEKQLVGDDRQEAYGSFFVDDFAHTAFAASDDVPTLQGPVFDLIADWRSASYAGALPSAIPSSIKQFHDAFVKAEVTATGILRYSDVILTKLSRELPDLIHDPALQRVLREKLVNISSEIAEANASVKQEIDGETVWQQFLGLHPFQMGLHGTMRLVYLAVYGAYESFVVRMLSLAHGGAQIRVTDRDFNEKFRKVFGNLIDNVWLASDVRAPRLVRHALMHAGGRLTEDLKAIKVPVIVHQDTLHVFPEHIRDLYNTLRVPALTLMEATCFRETGIEPPYALEPAAGPVSNGESSPPAQ